ncbi:CDGSH iron-sulfur domain-containing protein [Streptomyces sp. NPDC096934]|uniref:CDGSH iron-sulfur domain-containing protein n=1 Tax=Streptomyces sp. NPDC096934 TaxID=3155551 RepID=UPI00332FD35E
MTIDPHGPVLVEGPVEIVLDDGTVARSERFMVAICTCRRSRTYPWCDTSHRLRAKAADAPSPTRAPQPPPHRAGESERGTPSPDRKSS